MELSRSKPKKLLILPYISGGNYQSSKNKKNHSEKISYILGNEILKNFYEFLYMVNYDLD